MQTTIEQLLVVFAAGDGFALGQQITELAVVHLDAVIEVEADFLVGGVFEFFLEVEQFGLLFLEIVLLFLEFLAEAGAYKPAPLWFGRSRPAGYGLRAPSAFGRRRGETHGRPSPPRHPVPPPARSC